MLSRARSLQARLLPRGPLDVLWQVLLFAVAYYAYRLVRGWIDDPAGASVAFQNARNVIHLEQALGLFVEPSIQAWASTKPAVIDFAAWMYLNCQSSVTLGALVFLYLFHNRSFYFVRNMFVVAMALALVGYVLVPTAPPRFFPEWGFFDAVANFTGVQHDSVAVNALFNPYAAIPSMHVAFALMIGVPLSKLSRHRVVKVGWALYPLLVTFVIVATGNHFLTDAFLGALTAALAAWAAAWLARARPGLELRLGVGVDRLMAAPSPRRERAPIGSGVRREMVRNRLIESRLTPNAISLTGFVLNVVAAVLVWQELYVWGGVAFVVGSVCDTLDGRYSRMSGKGTQFGAFLDSTLDRIEEGIVLTAVAAVFAKQGKDVAAAAVVVAVLASLMVSYTRARAEALGVECKVGIASRAVRVVILSVGILFADLGALEPAVYVLAVLSTITVLQRIFHVRKALKASPAPVAEL